MEQLSNSVVHISVQLFSNQTLVTKMVQEQNLLHVMVKVLLEMMRTTLQPMKVNGKFMPSAHIIMVASISFVFSSCITVEFIHTT